MTQNTIAIAPSATPVHHHHSKKQQLNLLQHEQQGQRKQYFQAQKSPLLNDRNELSNSIDSSSSVNNDECQLNELGGRNRSSFYRPRSRSLSSPSRCSPIVDNEVSTMNQLYKERFPKATKQMEERLTNLITENKTVIKNNRDSQPIVRFVHHQVIEMARDCLHKSHLKLITSRYFFEMSENLERLLVETNEKSPEAAGEIAGIVKKLLLIISRPARLLECLEFDPEEFYHLLEAAEDQAKMSQGITADIPQYVRNTLYNISYQVLLFFYCLY